MTPPDRIAPGQRWRRPCHSVVIVTVRRLAGTLWETLTEAPGEPVLEYGLGGIVPAAYLYEHFEYLGPCDWFVAELKKGAAVG